jgi:hypothetical protein
LAKDVVRSFPKDAVLSPSKGALSFPKDAVLSLTKGALSFPKDAVLSLTKGVVNQARGHMTRVGSMNNVVP